MIKWIHQGLGGLKEIKISKRESFFVDSFSENGFKYIKAQKRGSFVNQLPRLIIETVCVVGILGFISVILYSDGGIASIHCKNFYFCNGCIQVVTFGKSYE